MADDLPYTIEQWSADDSKIEQVHARVGNGILARRVFMMAAEFFPNARLKLCDRSRIIDRRDPETKKDGPPTPEGESGPR